MPLVSSRRTSAVFGGGGGLDDDASAEEQRASTLGGNLPLVGMPGLPGRMTRTDQPDKVDGFDLGMNISGLILFPLAIALFSVPFWIGNIDVSDVGPPPMS